MPEPARPPLYDPAQEHDACGVGFLAHMKGRASHRLVSDALQVLENMSHRGASGCEPDSGDGAGVMVQTPHAFLRRCCRELGIDLPEPGRYAVGMLFLPQDLVARRACEQVLEQIIRDYGMVVLGFRDVPVDSRFVGPTPRQSEPKIRQIFVGMGEHFYNPKDFDRRLYLVRQRAENLVEHSPLWAAAQDTFYICILSTSRLVYKGMLTALQLRRYFPDLQEPDFQSALAMVHARFSTNTFPSWRLAQPFRYLAHNGEINTLRGNRNWMRARYGALLSEVFGDELAKMFPLFSEEVSDSATLDNALQLLTVNGRSLPHAALMLIPEAWQNAAAMDPELRAFYEYHACLMEPWDGPAAITFSNGKQIGALLDRNGLRPARYYVTRDDVVILASEVGVLPIAPEQVVKKGRVQPGRLFLVDTEQGRIIEDDEIKQGLLDQRPWGRYVRRLRDLADLPLPAELGPAAPAGVALQPALHAFGYSLEDLRLLLLPMARDGVEPVGSMGNDAPLACLSDQPQLLFNYFRQSFAQVTNPPLDAIREELVTSLWTYLGREGNLLGEDPESCRLLRLKKPLLGFEDFARLAGSREPALRAVTLPMLFPTADPAGPEAALRRALADLCGAAAAAVRGGAAVLVLSDRGVSAAQAPIPSLLATAAVHHHLIQQGSRTQAGLVIDTGEAREAHHLCLLLGYGASAVHPYLALSAIADLCATGHLPAGDVAAAQGRYLNALSKAVLKVASKMGISTLQSYRGAQIFEAVGLANEVIEGYFTHTAARLPGVGLLVLAREVLLRHQRGFPAHERPLAAVLHVGGQYQVRQGGEAHGWSPEAVARLQHAVRGGGPDSFAAFTEGVDREGRRTTLRGLLQLREAPQPLPLSEVEPAQEIVKRFVTGAMSFGSISQEAHETLAIAMNRIGGRSNTGEGGEDPARFQRDPSGDLRRSAIKQVASARFGVTLEYLVNADELQIKMAQGAKPGEGGQLPGDKVDDTIARLRHATRGVGLISPPPHHDIYSIEDLAQLIYDLKRVNPRARVSVKLVSQVGVGTVAAGVAKARADHILISGDGGGTGAAPLTSLKHAGLPWELGLAEAQQVLVRNRLRGRVRLQVDGQLKTGRDVMVAALLGAEEFGFATAPLIAMGCVMMRVCHLNTCPVGIATQDPELRRRFGGAPEHVINYLFFVAEEVRALLARLGLRSLEEAVGRADLLAVDADQLGAHWKARHLDLSALLYTAEAGPRRCVEAQDHALDSDGGLEPELLRHLEQALASEAPVRVALRVRNAHRSVGARLSGRIAERCGPAGLGREGRLTCHFSGSAGQSFGAFLAPGVTFLLEGDANDYLGKGLSGGVIAAFPPRDARFVAAHNVIAGNVIAYGATSGALFLRGLVGERFCVRNSGASAVVEGVGDHGCEYMTGGVVAVLGPTGRNFAAGMSGGVCYVLDDDGAFITRCNTELASVSHPWAGAPAEEALAADADAQALRGLLERHHACTASSVAAELLEAWPASLARFARVLPHDYQRARQQAARTAAVQQGGGGDAPRRLVAQAQEVR